ENLYTERGEYNTETEQAWFDRNNLYTEGSRFLRGDSIYYDGQSGNGRAVENVVFIDTADQYFTYGGEGVYNRADESITMTRNPLVMTITRNDSTATDSLVLDSASQQPLVTDSLIIDSVGRQPMPPDSLGIPQAEPPAIDTIYLTADTLFSRLIFVKDYVPRVFELDREGGEFDEYADEEYTDDFGNLDDFTTPSDDGPHTLARPPGVDSIPQDSATTPQVDTVGPVFSDTTSRPPPDSLVTTLKDTTAQKDRAITNKQAATDS